jgi:ABC-type arginine/histidine transport system permease subunit
MIFNDYGVMDVKGMWRRARGETGSAFVIFCNAGKMRLFLECIIINPQSSTETSALVIQH